MSQPNGRVGSIVIRTANIRAVAHAPAGKSIEMLKPAPGVIRLEALPMDTNQEIGHG